MHALLKYLIIILASVICMDVMGQDCDGPEITKVMMMGVDINKEDTSSYVNCPGDTIDLRVYFAQTGSQSFVWTANGEKIDAVTTETSSSISHTPTENTVYELVAEGGNCPGILFQKKVTIGKSLMNPLSVTDTILCKGDRSTLHITYPWGTDLIWYRSSDNITFSEWTKKTEGTPQLEVGDNFIKVKFEKKGGCDNDFSNVVKINVKPRPVVKFEQLSISLCSGDELKLDPNLEMSGNYTYKWRRDGEVINDADLIYTEHPTEGAMYEFEIQGEACPVQTFNISVDVYEKENIYIDAESEVICKGESVYMQAGGVESIADDLVWEKKEEGETEFHVFKDFFPFTVESPEVTTTYRIIAKTGLADCPANPIPFTINVLSEKPIPLDDITVCPNEELVVDIPKLAGFDFVEWTNEEGFFSNEKIITVKQEESGSYHLKLQKGECISESSLTINVEEPPVVIDDAIPFTQAVCLGDAVDLEVKVLSGDPAMFYWEANGERINSTVTSTSTKINHIPTGNTIYELNIDGYACSNFSYKRMVTIRKPSSIILECTGKVCENSNPTFFITTDDTSLVWLRSYDNQTFEEFDFYDPSALKLTETTYYKVRSDNGGSCKEDTSNVVKVEVEMSPHAVLDNIPTKVCSGDSIEINAAVKGAETTEWRKNGVLFSRNELSLSDVVTEDVTYEFEAHGTVCPSEIVQIPIKVIEKEILTIVASKSSVCIGEDVKLSPSINPIDEIVWEKGDDAIGWNSFDYSNPEPLITPATTTSYRVRGNMGGCELTSDPITIDVYSKISLTIPDTTICKEDEAIITIPDIYDIVEWKRADDATVFSSDNMIRVAPEETANYRVSVEKGKCSAEADFTINVVETPHIISHEFIDNTSCKLTVDLNTPVFFNYDENREAATSEIITGLLAGSTYNIEVSNEYGCFSTYVINTPSIDLIFPPYFIQGEENWKVGNLEKYSNFTVKILDRYGKLLSTHTDADGWDGIYNGHAMPSTDYWYIVDVSDLDKQFTGHFTLLRRK